MLSKELQAADSAKRKALVEEMRQKVASLQSLENVLQERVNKLTERKQQTGDNAIELEFSKGELERAENVYQRICRPDSRIEHGGAGPRSRERSCGRLPCPPRQKSNPLGRC